MYQFIVALILIVCVLLAIVVLVQNSKGGGLAANFSAPNQIMGVRKTTDFLEKATWTLAAILVVLSLAATVAVPRNHDVKEAAPEVTVDNSQMQLPANTTTAPVAEQPAAEQPAE